MTIHLTEDSEILDEVVVVGYSSEKKSDLTGSVSVVKMKDVSDTPTGNVIQALQGRVAGMNITTDGTPGGLSTGTSIRGTSSFRSEARYDPQQQRRGVNPSAQGCRICINLWCSGCQRCYNHHDQTRKKRRMPCDI